MWRLKWDTQTRVTRRSLCAVLYSNLCCCIGPLLLLSLFPVLSLEIHVKQGIHLHIYKNCKECHAVIRNNLFYLQLARYTILAYSEQDCIWQCANSVWNVSTSLQHRVWEMIEISHQIIYLYCTDWSKLCLFYLGQFNQMSLNILGRIK